MARVIIVQHIRTNWSKASRGGTGAARRNAVPEAVKAPLPLGALQGLTLLHQTVDFSESDNFSQPTGKIHINPSGRPLTIGCVSIDYDEETMSAQFVYNWTCGGEPERNWMQHTLTLALNEWGRIVYNGRFAGEGYCWYEKKVVNVGMFDTPSNSVFTRSKPHQRYASLARLF